MTKEDVLDVSIKIIGIYWFLKSLVVLLAPLIFYSPFRPEVNFYNAESAFTYAGPSVIAFILSLLLMVRSGAIVNLLYGRRSTTEKTTGETPPGAGT